MLKLTFRVAAMAAALATLAVPVTAQVDPFASLSDNVQAPSRHATPITPSDTVDLARVPKSIYVGGGGNLTVIGVDAPVGATGVTFRNLPDSAVVPFRARRVLATGTTTTFLVALY